MEIIQKFSGDVARLVLEGRLDAYSAEHLTGTIQQLAREGKREVALDMAGLVFLSSAGIRSLLKGAREMRTIGGAMTIINPSPAVLEVLQLARLEMLVSTGDGTTSEPKATPAPEPRPQPVNKASPEPAAEPAGPIREGTFEGVTYRVLGDGSNVLTGNLVGDPGAVGTRAFNEKDCGKRTFEEPVTGLGLAALGDGFEECKGRFGEFLAVGGAFTYQATDRGQRADYLVTTGQLVPEAQVLYALEARGELPVVVAFEAEPMTPVKLSDLAKLALKETGQTGEAVMFVAIAEAQGLVGVSLRKSLALATDPAAAMRYPEVREWMNFTTEPVHTESVVLIVGVAVPEAGLAASGLGAFVRPIAPGVMGHVHAAAFSYKPLRKDVTRIMSSVEQLFEEQALKGVLHLLNDTRPINGNGESLFVRGTLWAGRLGAIKTQGSNP